MPRDLYNWQFKGITEFLKQHFFKLVDVTGSHHHYQGNVDRNDCLVQVQKHTGQTIKPRTLNAIITQSKIPKDLWTRWGNAGQRRLRKRIQYTGARPFS